MVKCDFFRNRMLILEHLHACAHIYIYIYIELIIPHPPHQKKNCIWLPTMYIYVAFLEMLLVLFFFFFFLIEATLINLIIRKLVLTFWLIRCKVYKRIFFDIPSSKNIMLSLWTFHVLLCPIPMNNYTVCWISSEVD